MLCTQPAELMRARICMATRPRLIASVPARVVVVSSNAHKYVDAWDGPALPARKGFGSDNATEFRLWSNYGRAKLAKFACSGRAAR